MGRPRTFVTDDVQRTIMNVFWERGYRGTSLSDLENATGLNRSSLYQAFGGKDHLFGAALQDYVDTVVPTFLGGMERPEATVADIPRFFRGMAARFRGDTVVARRGCLWVNSIIELAGAREPVDVRSDEYRTRLCAAFENALTGPRSAHTRSRASTARRARMLMATTFGAWVGARIGPTEAARTCEAVAAEVRTWASETSVPRVAVVRPT